MQKMRSFKWRLWLNFGVVLGTIAAALVILYFLSSDLAAQSEKIISDKAYIAQQTAIIAALAGLKDNAAQSVPYANAMKQLLPTHDALIGFGQWLTAIGESHGVSVSFAFQGSNVAATESSPGSDGFSMGVGGSSDSIVGFINYLETQSSEFLISVDSFDLVNNGGSYQISIQGRVFSR